MSRLRRHGFGMLLANVVVCWWLLVCAFDWLPGNPRSRSVTPGFFFCLSLFCVAADLDGDHRRALPLSPVTWFSAASHIRVAGINYASWGLSPITRWCWASARLKPFLWLCISWLWKLKSTSHTSNGASVCQPVCITWIDVLDLTCETNTLLTFTFVGCCGKFLLAYYAVPPLDIRGPSSLFRSSFVLLMSPANIVVDAQLGIKICENNIGHSLLLQVNGNVCRHLYTHC